MTRVRNTINRDLIRYANDSLFLITQEKQALLREASAAIRCYQTLAAISGHSANDDDADLAVRLSRFGDDIDFRYADETKAIMLEAADASDFCG
ncbi:hypothetical protein [Phyllobacterium sophorae]|uniref:Uncharacterized protein n=1 Tax=Phyllobacterium sophorae TaxID=1520277 RepID=A0A2P7B6K5_9HYPH|nr:hypothetical protein [Phyllobacterium sophorae]PSH62088.1 hypothetical protein CU103_19745 [Phyllobacterium sophorae]